MFMVKPLSKGCENTSASGMAADSFNAASGVYRSWKCASAAPLVKPASNTPITGRVLRHRGRRNNLLLNVAAIDGDGMPLTGIEFHAEGHLGLGKCEGAVL